MAWDSNNKTCPCIKTPYTISIFTAATYGDCSSLSKKLSLYPLYSLPQTDDSGFSPLSCVKMLVEAGADVLKNDAS